MAEGSSANSIEYSLSNKLGRTSISNEDDEDSFVILGSTPSPSMMLDGDAPEKSNSEITSSEIIHSVMEKSTSTQDPQSFSMKNSNHSLIFSMLNSQNSAGANSISIKDMSLGEIQKQFNILIEENMQMKENLMQNNNDLRREFNKIMKYQEEVRKTHDEHREKFDETRKLVNKLKTENATLKENLRLMSTTDNNHWKEENGILKLKLNEMTSLLDSMQSEQESFKNKTSQMTSSMSELSNENDLLKLKLNQSEEQIKMILNEKTELERELERTNMEVKIFTERKDEMNTKINDYKNQIANFVKAQHKSDTMMVDLNAELKLCREQLQKAHMNLAKDKRDFEMLSESEINPELHQNSSLFVMPSSSVDTVARLRLEIQNLQQQLKVAQTNRVVLTMEPLSMSQHQDFSYSDSKGSEVEKKVRFYEKNMQDLVLWYNTHCKRVSELQSILGELSLENVTSLEQVLPKLKQLKTFSNELYTELTTQWSIFKSAQNNFQTIFNEYNNLTKEIDSVITTNQVKEEVFRREIIDLKSQLDETHAKVLAKDELIQLKTDEVLKKQVELDSIKKDNSEIEILKSQLNIYKLDYDEERDARQRIAGEKDSLATDLRLLQQRNEQLMLEIRNQKQGTPSANSGLNTASAPPENARTPTSLRKNQYSCPLCFNQFPSYETLQEHVEDCGNIV